MPLTSASKEGEPHDPFFGWMVCVSHLRHDHHTTAERGVNSFVRSKHVVPTPIAAPWPP